MRRRCAAAACRACRATCLFDMRRSVQRKLQGEWSLYPTVIFPLSAHSRSDHSAPNLGTSTGRRDERKSAKEENLEDGGQTESDINQLWPYKHCFRRDTCRNWSSWRRASSGRSLSHNGRSKFDVEADETSQRAGRIMWRQGAASLWHVSRTITQLYSLEESDGSWRSARRWR